MTLGRISLRLAYQLNTSHVVKRAGRQSFHYFTRSQTAISRLHFTTLGVHLLYLAIGMSFFLSWSDAFNALLSHAELSQDKLSGQICHFLMLCDSVRR